MKKLHLALVKLGTRISNLKISTQIVMFYFAILVFSVLFSGFTYQRFYNRTLSEKVSEVSVQTLYSISSNLEAIIENAKNLSKVILSSDEIQEPLRGIIEGGDSLNLDQQRAVNSYISTFIEAFPFLSSIYIFDNNSQRYGIDKMPLKALATSHIEDAPWYGDAVEAEGGFILRLNAGGILGEREGEHYISLIRIINDVYSQKPIGVLLLNLSENAFSDAFKDILNRYDTDIRITDGEGQTFVDFDHPQLFESLDSNRDHTGDGATSVKAVGGVDYLLSYLSIPKYGWNITSAMPFEELSRESKAFNAIAVGIIALNSLLLFLGAIFISRLITHPIKKLLGAMKGVEKGVFEEVAIISGENEIGKLRDAYNIMIREIKNLIHKVVEDQKIKRKAELDILQAQIKPHFLYNTFDAISSLALSGKNTEVYRVMKALGSYYRISLSKGSEVITLADELEVVKNYLAIQLVRYGDAFSLEYAIDERALPYKIPKLILQPIVENAIYHGIKPKGEKGAIRIEVRLEGDWILLSVFDDGVGMEKSAIDALLDSSGQDRGEKGFGLKGTLERLRIFYGVADPMRIESERWEGTRILLKIPARLENRINALSTFKEDGHAG